MIEASPLGALLLISFLLTMLISLAYKFFTNQKELKQHKEEMKVLQNEIKKLKDNPEKAMQKQKELMEKNFKMMGQSIKPMIITFIPIVILFGWLRGAYDPIGKLIFGLTWFWVYFISAIIFSALIRKVLKIY